MTASRYITRDGGKHWTNITPKDLPEFSRISMIDASPHEPGTAYLAAKRYQLDDRKPYIYRTHDFGKTWTKIVNGIPDNDFAHVAREDPKRAACSMRAPSMASMFPSMMARTGNRCGLNLPDTQVADLVVQDDDLVVATHGRSFWVLDDIDILRQLEPVRSPHRHFICSNPMRRPLIPSSRHRLLPAEACRQDQRSIFSIRTAMLFGLYGLAETKRRSRPTPTTMNPTSGVRAAVRRDSQAAGTNRFTWDLRYPGATVFEGEVLWSARAEQGPLAVPGNYQVRVTANGQTQTQPLAVKLDPREHVTHGGARRINSSSPPGSRSSQRGRRDGHQNPQD